MGNEKYGFHLVSENLGGTLYNRYKTVVRGVCFRKGWKYFETSAGTFDYNWWKDQINIAIADGLYASIQSIPSPVSNDNTPQWLFNAPYAVPFVTTDRGTFPYQMNANFIDRFRSHWNDGIKNMLLSYSSGDRLFLLSWMSAEGTTGDPGTIHGAITQVTILGVIQSTPQDYLIPDNIWLNHKRTNLWPYGYGIQQASLPFINFEINTGNDFENIEWLQANAPKAWFKVGFASHTYNNPGEKWRQEGIKLFVNSAPDDNRNKQECEQTPQLSWFANALKSNFKATLTSCIAHGCDIFMMSMANLNSIIGVDLSLITWANQYLGFRRADETDKGFLMLRKILDFANIILYSVDTYGPVITPSQQAGYTSTVNQINANAGYSAIQKKLLITQLTVSKLNIARVNAMLAAFPAAAYHTVDTGEGQDAYNTDCGVDMMQNYEKFLYQSFVDPGEEGVWRFGPANTFDSRFGKKAPKFYIWTDLLSNGNYQVKVQVKYHDVDSIQWSLKYNNGAGIQIAGTITNGTSGNVLTTVFVIPNIQGGRIMTNSSDFIIETINPVLKITVEQIDFTRVSQNGSTNMPPIADAGSNQTITAPVAQVTLAGSGTDMDGTITNYLWTKISGTGGVFANAADPATVFSGLTEGVYILQLQVTDNNSATDTDTVTITVNPGAPVASAGSNQTITLPVNSTTLNASGSTAVSGTITGYAWSKISGPSGSAITTPSSVSTGITGLIAGTYVYQVTVTNSFTLTDSATVTIVVQPSVPVNQPPVANAGTDQTIDIGVTTQVSLFGIGTDTDGTVVSYAWLKLSGTGGTITAPGSQSTNVTGLSVGTYVLQLTVTDNLGATGTDTIVVTVNPAANDAPIANAGINQTITLPASTATLDGSASTDDTAITDQLWIFVSGPVTPSITTPASLITGITGMTSPGDYIFRLYVQDIDGLTDHDGVRVRVLSADNPPVTLINTPDSSVTLPVDSISVDATVSAGDNPVDTIVWTQQSGPATATITTAGGSTLEVAYQGHPFTISSYAFTLKGMPVEGDYVQFDFSINLNPVDPPVDYSINSIVLAGWSLADLITDLYNKAFAINGATLTYTDGDGNNGVRVRGFDTSNGFAQVTQVAGGGIDVEISDLIAGLYVFRLTATDTSGNQSFDEIIITVNDAVILPPVNPVAIIDPVSTVHMPAAVIELIGINSYDPDGTVVGYLWELAGDSPTLGGYVIDTPTAAQTIINFTTPGTYKFQLTVTDNNGLTNTTSVTFKVNQPPSIVLNPSEANLILPVNYLSVNATVVDVDGTITLQWVQLLGGTATIDNPTTDDINITDLEEGEYLFRLYATDNDGAQTYEDLVIFVNVASGGERFRKTFLFYLCNDQGVAYKEESGLISLESHKALRYAPEGWQDIEVKMPRNTKYLGLERNFTSSYKFVKDGAAIIRYLLFNQTQRGIASKLHLVVLKWDTITGVYEPYFISEVDLSEAVDDPKTGVTCNLIQGGAVKSIKTNDTVIYEIPCNATNANAVQVKFDRGVDLNDTLKYTVVPTDPIDANGTSILGITFISNEGDSIGVLRGSQAYTHSGISSGFFKTSANYLIAAGPSALTFHITGKVIVHFINEDTVGGDYHFDYIIADNDNETYHEIELFSFTEPTQHEFDIDLTIILLPGQKFFIVSSFLDAPGNTDPDIYYEQTDIVITYVTAAPETTCYAERPFDLATDIVEQMTEGKYKFESQLLHDHWYLLAIAGDSLRGIATATIKSSFADFFQSYGTILGAAIGVRQSDQCILFEKKEYFFDNGSEIIDLGEVEGLEFSIAKEFLFNTVNVGYPDQNYQERNGRNEFNSTQNYTLPQDRVVAALDLISKYRADPYGIEFIRFELFNKQTTDNVGDNNVFIVNVQESGSIYAQFNGRRDSDQEIAVGGNIEFETYTGTNFTVNGTIDEFTFTGAAQNLEIALNIALSGVNTTTIFAYIRVNNSQVAVRSMVIVGGTAGATFGVNNFPLLPGDVVSFRVESMSADFTVTYAAFTVTFSAVTFFIPKRLTYDAITGIDSASSIYNIEELTPKRILLANSFYTGMLYQVPGDLVQFQSGKKNVLLSTTLDGVTITENANVRVEQFAASPVRPVIVEFNTKVPVNILYLLQNAGKGYITFTWNGVRLYAFPMELSVKPAFRDAQNWRCLISSLTDLPGLEKINQNVLLIEDNGMISHKNSLKWVTVNDATPLQYHFKHMDNDWHKNRITRYSVTEPYYQKMQTNDTTPIQFITRSASCIIKIYTCRGKLVDTVSVSQISNPAVVMPFILLQAEIDWSQYTPGTYYCYLKFGVGSGASEYISEPIELAEDWPKTLLINFGNSLNKPDMIFNGGYRGKMRVEGMIHKFDMDSRWTSFEDEPLDVDTLDDISFRRWELFIGGAFGMPDWIFDKIARMIKLDSWQADGYYYQVEPGAKWEKVEISGSPYVYARILIREQNNRQGIPITGSGFDGGELTVEYNINTKGFTALESPTTDATDNIIQVIDVD